MMNARLLPILGIILINFIAIGVIIPMLPSLAVHFHAQPLTIGLMFAMFPFFRFISGPLLGNMSDHFGRKSVLVLSLSAGVVSSLITAFAPDIRYIFLARTIDGCFAGSIGVTQAAIADVIPPEERAQAFGHLGLMFGLGILIVPLIGIASSHDGFSLPFLVTAGLTFIALILALAFFPESRSHEEKPKGAISFHEIITTFHDPLMAHVLAQRLATMLGISAWFSVEVLFLSTHLRFDTKALCMYYVLKAVVIMLTNGFLIGPLTKRLSDQAVANAGFVSLAVAFTLVPFTHNIPTLIFMGACCGMGMELMEVGIFASITKIASAERQGTSIGVCSSIDAFSGMIGPLVGAGLFGWFGASSSGFVPFVLPTRRAGDGNARRRASIAKESGRTLPPKHGTAHRGSLVTL
jgi:DHA1 family tetracycline resistance protein-like MFS transporter